jgi:hypothetical protein
MKRYLICVGIISLLAASLALARGHKGGLNGTWDCRGHGGALGEITFTLFLQASGETVDGSITSPMGATQVSSGTIRHNQVELHFDMPQGSYVLVGKFEKGQLSGAWSLDSDKGVWEGVKHVDAGK